MSFDNDPGTIWHTRWSTGNDPYPHEIQVGLGGRYRISKFTYLTRQDGENGRIKNYELYVSDDTLDWGAAVSAGQFANTPAPQTIVPDTAKTGRYFRLVALSEVNGNPWASAAEFTLVGCVDWPVGVTPGKFTEKITAFPVPTDGIVNISLPSGPRFSYQVVSSTGRIAGEGTIENHSGSWPVSLGSCPAGMYLVKLTDDRGVIFCVKVEKR
jgi:hypothetical protein